MPIRTVFENRAPKPEGMLSAMAKRFVEKRLKAYAADHGRTHRRMAVFAHDLMGTQINLYGRGERDEIDDLFLFLAPVMDRLGAGVALDVGANVGNHTDAFAGLFRAVAAFEPNPATLELLRINTRDLPNVTVCGYGLGAANRVERFVEGKGNLGESRIVAELSAQVGSGSLEVDIRRLDDVAGALGAPITFVKIDVEGHERQVLEGGRATIAANAPVIVFEQHRGEFSGGTTPAIDLLRAMGYAICWSEYPRERVKVSLLRDLWKFADRLRRRRPAIVTGERVTEKSHSMLIAVPPGLQPVLLGR